MDTSTLCYFYNNTEGYCWGSRARQHVFGNYSKQDDKELQLRHYVNDIKGFLKLAELNILDQCLATMKELYCHKYFPTCDQNTYTIVPQPICKESCSLISERCRSSIMQRSYSITTQARGYSSRQKHITPIINCTLLSTRSAGLTPECYYNEEMNSKYITTTIYLSLVFLCILEDSREKDVVVIFS